MKMLFSSSDLAEVKRLRRKLFAAGIQCQVRQNPVAHGVFGTPSLPELWITDHERILKALKLFGKQRLSQMTVIVPKD